MYKYYKLNDDIVYSDGKNHKIVGIVLRNSIWTISDCGSYYSLKGAKEINRQDFVNECKKVLENRRSEVIEGLNNKIKNQNFLFERQKLELDKLFL